MSYFSDNPFIKAASNIESSAGNVTAGGASENPFFSLSKPITISSSAPKGFNIFGKPQDNSAIIGGPKPNNVTYVDAKVDSLAANVADVKNPFFTDTSLPTKSLQMVSEKVEIKAADKLPNPFLVESSMGGAKIIPSSLSNPFLEKVATHSVPSNVVNPFIAVSSTEVHSKPDEKNVVLSGNLSKDTGSIPQVTNNPFLSSTCTLPMFSGISSAPNKDLGQGNKGRNSPFFVPAADLPKDNINIFTKSESVPAKLESKIQRSSLDELKPSLSLLADNLKSVICTDSESKYDVLEKIDKAIRKGVKSNFHVQDGKRYRALKGTCVDMCPEKERYFRDDKHQISPYELNKVQDIVSTFDGNYPQLDHRKAVKEYSRSSADQEEPLPHQLRPAPVLSYTMDYLVMNIMDVKYSKRTDWFDFLWNRTRAIRKDITQQNLGCLQTISIIERCARFHIFCSHYLCEHELHVFEPKMNLENLTKCLQTLKHLYEDRWKECKDILSNEPEFRCYQILLNLNDGDMLREVMQFRKEVRESLPVKFALKVYSAVHDNNYIKFFKLLKSTTYMNACVLQPYFTQIRQSALTVMVRTFSQQNMDVPFPLDNLQKILAFDDQADAIDFCLKYGLHAQDSNVYFNRSSFSKPEDPIPIKMSAVVTEKLMSPMSEIVNNGPPNACLDIREPVNSFSVEGTYVGSYHLLDDDTFNDSIIEEVKTHKAEVAQDIFSPAVESQMVETDVAENDFTEVIEEDVIENDDGDDESVVCEDDDDDDDEVDGQFQKDDPDYTVNEDGADDEAYDDEYSGNSGYSDEEGVVMFLREDFLAYIDDLLNEEISESIDHLCTDILEEVKEEMVQSEVMTDQELAIMCIEQTRMAVSEVIDEEQLKLDNERELLEKEIEEDAFECSENLIDESVKVVLLSICEDVCKDEIDILEANVLTNEIENHSCSVLNSTMSQEINHVASEVINETCLDRKKLLESKKQSISKKKLGIMFKRWIKAYKQQQFIKSSLIDFPPLPPLITTKEAVRKLHPDGDISYSLPSFSNALPKVIEPKVKEDIAPLDISMNMSFLPETFSKPLSSIVEDAMSTLFFKVFHEHCLFCESMVLPAAQPNLIIQFYNNTLKAITSGLKLLSDIDEKQIGGLISSLELPLMSPIDPYDWELCCSECEMLVGRISDRKSSILLSRIDNILNRHLSRLTADEEIIFPWSEILEVCIFSKMSCMYLDNESYVNKINFQISISCGLDFISSLNVVNPLKTHIKEKRDEYFTLKSDSSYLDGMKKKKFAREYNLRKSLDSVDSELNRLEATFLKRSKSLRRERSSSLQELLNESTSFLGNVEIVKQSHATQGRSYSSTCLESSVHEESAVGERKSPLEKLSGSKRTFEFSMMECLQGIEDYRLKLKTREDYWREIIKH